MKDQELKRKKRTQRDYSIGFKLRVASQVENGDYTYKQAQKEYGIQGRSTVLVWLRRYGNLNFILCTILKKLRLKKLSI